MAAQSLYLPEPVRERELRHGDSEQHVGLPLGVLLAGLSGLGVQRPLQRLHQEDAHAKGTPGQSGVVAPVARDDAHKNLRGIRRPISLRGTFTRIALDTFALESDHSLTEIAL